MTVVNINIPADLEEEFERVFAGEPPEAVIERLMRAEIARRTRGRPPESGSIVNTFRRLSEKFPPLSMDEIRRLREDGRP